MTPPTDVEVALMLKEHLVEKYLKRSFFYENTAFNALTKVKNPVSQIRFIWYLCVSLQGVTTPSGPIANKG